MDRRKFLKRAGLAALATTAVGGAYPLLEAKWCRLARTTITVPNLPAPFRGTTVALLADVHHGPFVPLAYIRQVVAMTNALRPDLVLLAGDYMHRSAEYIEPGIAALGKLEARIGRFAVRGNHDNRNFTPITCDALAEADLPDLNNTGVWIERRAPGSGSAASATSGPTARTSTRPSATPGPRTPRSSSRTTPTSSSRSATRGSGWS